MIAKIRKLMFITYTVILIAALLVALTGCESSTVSKVVFSSGEIIDEKALKNEDSLDKAPASKDLYANILFIESPEGMKYGVKWVCDGNVVKEEEKKMTKNQKGIISYLIEGDKFKKGNYSFEIYYKDKKIYEEKLIAE